MDADTTGGPGGASASAKVPRPAFYNDPQVRSIFYQTVVVVLLALGLWSIIDNTITNLQTRNIAQGFGFLDTTAGFDLSVALIDYPRDATYGRAIMVGLANTLLVAVVGIFFASILGFLIGIARLSKNFVISKLATWYVEVIRNLPLLLQLFFWYFGVLQILPQPRQSLEVLPGAAFINNRGLFIPQMNFGPGVVTTMLVALVVALVAASFVRRWAKKRQEATGQQFPTLLTTIGLIVALPLAAFLVSGAQFSLTYPRLQGFNFQGGSRVVPEFVALLLALTTYTAAFIAEIVRAGILAVSHGQTEAARSLGLRPSPTLRLVIIPQAMRVIIPPLTSQYLNLTKNSSLAVVVGYPDLVYVGGTVLNQTGQAVEVVAIWMLIYLTLSLTTSAFMNWYNRRMAIVER